MTFAVFATKAGHVLLVDADTEDAFALDVVWARSTATSCGLIARGELAAGGGLVVLTVDDRMMTFDGRREDYALLETQLTQAADVAERYAPGVGHA